MNRIEWIDITKGIGIILVIAGHCIQYSLCKVIYSFHMPLFFFLSGVLFSSLKYTSWTNIFIDKVRSILKPFCVIWLISLLCAVLIPEWRKDISISNFLSDLYLGTPAMVYNTSLWFLICLFITIIISFIFLKAFGRRKIKLPIIILFLFYAIVSCFIVKLLNYIDKTFLITIPYNRLPLKIDTALVASVFYIVGSRFKEFFDDYVTGRKFKFKYDIVILCLIWLVGSYFNSNVNLHAFYFGNTILFYIVAFAGILFLAKFSHIISTNKDLISIKLKKILLFYGVNSLIIFGFQSLFLRIYIYICNSYLNENLILYGANPIIHQLLSLAFITFVFSPLIVSFFLFLRKKNMKII